MKKIILGLVFLGLVLLHACKDDPQVQPNVNSSPANVMITSTSVIENQPSGTLVGVLSTTDSDDSDTHTYSLVSGEGDDDNASFSIDGANLNTNAVFDYESDSLYTIRVQTEDNEGGTFQRAFTISIVIDIPFITTWQTTSANESITILTIGDGYNYSVNWGDGTMESAFTGAASHTYATAGTYTVEMAGAFPRIHFNFFATNNATKIQDISQWGNNPWVAMNSAFFGCSSLSSSATDAPDLSKVTNMSSMFQNAFAFNGDLSSWDVSNVTNMSSMFQNADAFNQDLSSWDVSNVTNMSRMFGSADAFNQDLSSWDVSNVTTMEDMFAAAFAFNQDLSSWDVSNVTTMKNMFEDADAFNQDLSSWDVSNVTTMERMFAFADAFNQDLSSWDVSNVTTMEGMFIGADAFNQDLSSWDVSNVTTMERMFEFADAFNQDLSSWDVSNVTNMSFMFLADSAFNQDLSSWDVSNVTNMSFMFAGATLSTANYDALLIGWSGLTLQNGVSFDGGNSQYSSMAATARQSIIDNYGWTISDGGQN